jgi:hypothetical protein
LAIDIGFACRAGLGYATKGISADIAKIYRIFAGPNAQRV